MVITEKKINENKTNAKSFYAVSKLANELELNLFSKNKNENLF